DLGGGVSAGSRGPAPAAPLPASRPAAKVAVSPSVTAALAAVAEARQATGTESPAEAGASYARGGTAPARVAAAPPKPKPPAAASAAAANGPWRVQLGAFSVPGNADKLWARLSGRAELTGHSRLSVPAGAVTKLQAGGFATRADAESACRSLQRNGQECLVTR
uniref:SPOR domain-containing protein n=1 Tax=Altererythrobacter segetis TaxID=1104773 RepID=UPI00140A1278